MLNLAMFGSNLQNNPISHAGSGYELLEDKIVIWFN